MSETKSNKVEAPKKAAPKKVAPANDAQLFISPALSAIFWTISLLIVVAVIFGNYYYTTKVLVDESNIARLVRVLVVILGFVIALVVALLTNKGRTLLQFGRQAYTELKKVVWPGFDDVVSSIKVVLLSTLFVAIVLGLLDWLFVSGMNLIF